MKAMGRLMQSNEMHVQVWLKMTKGSFAGGLFVWIIQSNHLMRNTILQKSVSAVFVYWHRMLATLKVRFHVDGAVAAMTAKTVPTVFVGLWKSRGNGLLFSRPWKTEEWTFPLRSENLYCDLCPIGKPIIPWTIGRRTHSFILCLT